MNFHNLPINSLLKLFLGYLSFISPPPLNKWLCILRGVRIKRQSSVWIGVGVLIDNKRPDLITINDNVTISSGAKVLSHFQPPKSFEKLNFNYQENPINIMSNVYVGSNARSLPGVNIGSYSVIGAGAVVTKDVPCYCIVAGNPAKIIKKFDNL